MSGLELANGLKELQPNLKVLYMSGYTDNAIMNHGVMEGDSFIQKPFAPLSLVQLVRKVLDEKQSER